ncbi:hypothetical protein [Paenibacillus radicis (ex Xue et al. 2023)]|uniref:Uncharacterized protein n=1 Tax=Paenibacillus radicis (ex Xue et al. 2023) TaxID=2972489 RepID=A0ABT1YUS4_9BACL|nr:hypothetical protein [Paenibacillus radicis (ex Xue et al. 2023)]MCR8636598.1 hypothetical protein [Paenibacillus radicis (ex Xue et al. 2023)]
MKFSFEVGVKEKHIVEFKFNQIIGNLSISIDQQRRVTDFRMFSLSLIKTYEFKVGKQEMHDVRIEKERKLLLAGFRKSKYKVFIDEVLSYEYEGW